MNKYRKLIETGGKITAKNIHSIHKTYPLMTVARTYNTVEVQKETKEEAKKKSNLSSRKSHLSSKVSKSLTNK